jgi:outer membrane lipoprotein SlyB
MKRLCLMMLIVMMTACMPPLTGREKGGLAGYLIGSGLGAGLGAAAGDPLIGAVAGGPVGAAIGVEVANRRQRDEEMTRLQQELAQQEYEIQRLQEGLRRLSRRDWLEP